MQRILCLLVLTCAAVHVRATELYLRSFGDSLKPAVIFLHGGPGYNSALFEGTAAQRLADSGYFVIVYDRRGEGRSRDSLARYTFEESTADLQHIYCRFGLKKAVLIGHSFGGVVGIRFAAAAPKLVDALILVGAPLNIQASFRNILDRCQRIYEQKNDSMNLGYLRTLRSMDTASVMYSTYCLGHAMQNGFYAPRERSAASRAVYAAYRADTALAPYASKMDFLATKGFHEHERYTSLDLRPEVKALRKMQIHIFGIYGQEDGLYGAEQLAELQQLLGSDRMVRIEGASHNVFLDQPEAFIGAVRRWTR